MKQFTIYIGTDGAPQPGATARSTVAKLADEYLVGATIYYATGLWEGAYEDSVVVTVLAGEGNRVWDFARAVHEELTQDSVLVTEQDVQATLVTGDEQ